MPLFESTLWALAGDGDPARAKQAVESVLDTHDVPNNHRVRTAELAQPLALAHVLEDAPLDRPRVQLVGELVGISCVVLLATALDNGAPQPSVADSSSMIGHVQRAHTSDQDDSAQQSYYRAVSLMPQPLASSMLLDGEEFYATELAIAEGARSAYATREDDVQRAAMPAFPSAVQDSHLGPP